MPEGIFIIGSLAFLIAIISTTFVLSKRLWAMYEVFLVTIGIVLAVLSELPHGEFLQHFRLDPEVLIYGLLPVLLLEIAFTMHYKDIVRNIRSISLLAIVSPIISTFAIGFLLKYGASGLFSYEIPLSIALLFGSVMSSTDPVTVLSIFKKLGAPRKLVLLFEGESLFNDGASLALFSLLLAWVIGSKAHTTVFETVVTKALEGLPFGAFAVSVSIFIGMIVGGIILGTLSGIIFSKILLRLKSNEYLAILTILVSAYTTFAFTDYVDKTLLPASAIIATIFSTFIIGNYGRYKITIHSEELAHDLFSFIAFIVNSFVFLLIGTSVSLVSLATFDSFKLLALLAVLTIIVSRAISVYVPLTILGKVRPSAKIPESWMHVLAWGSLRWWLALALVASIPLGNTILWNGQPTEIRQLLEVLVLASVLFSIFVKSLTLEGLMERLGVTKLTLVEKIEEEEAKLLVITNALETINAFYEKKYLTSKEKKALEETYRKRQEQVIESLRELSNEDPDTESHSAFQKLLSLHALSLEKYHAKELFVRGEITEKPLKRFLALIDRQTYRVKTGKSQLREITSQAYQDDIFETFEKRIAKILNPDPNPIYTEYLTLRARVLILDNVIQSLTQMHELSVQLGRETEYNRVGELYVQFYQKAIRKRDVFFTLHEKQLEIWREKLTKNTFRTLENTVIENLTKKEFISDRLMRMLKFQEEDFQMILGKRREPGEHAESREGEENPDLQKA